MKKQLKTLATVTATVVTGLCLQVAAHAATITKAPDRGPYWHPLSTHGTYVYADSFVAPVNGVVTSLGTWLNTESYDASTTLKFQVWGSVGGNAVNGPDWNQVLATTAPISGFSGGLTLYSGSPTLSSSLIAGNTYWFAATAVGSTGSGSYQVGGHTQNSGSIVDNGTFWYSNDSAGHNFDGRRLTPEMAFTVSMGPSASVPEAGWTALMLGIGMLALVGLKREGQALVNC